MPTSSSPTEFHASRLFVSWLAEQHASLAFTTYQAGKLFFVGLNAKGELAIFNRTLARVMGLAVHEQRLWVASLWQLWRFENALQPGQAHGANDRWYVPQLAYTTGDIDVHDVAVDGNGEPVFVSTLFSCLARPDPQYSLRPIWKPPFVSRYAAEDRCHLNGLAMRDGEPAFVTCVGRSDANEGWREHRREGGLLIDVASNEIVAEGKAEGVRERERQLELARAEVAQEINRAREELRGEVSAIAVASAEKILRREIDPKAHEDILSRLAAEL